MFTLLNYIDAFGTSEGVRKEWDSRKRSGYDNLQLVDKGQKVRVGRKAVGKSPWHLIENGQRISNHRDH